MMMPEEFLRKETVATWNGALTSALEKQLNAYVRNSDIMQGFYSHLK